METGLLIWAFLFSVIGLAFFIYGKKQKALVPLACGLVLMFYPYFVPNVFLMVAVGVVLIALPYFIRI